MPRCHKCQKALSSIVSSNDHPSKWWRYVNAAPDAASGGTMVPMCNDCAPIIMLTPPPVSTPSS
jgi:hypothetical protein